MTEPDGPIVLSPALIDAVVSLARSAVLYRQFAEEAQAMRDEAIRDLLSWREERAFYRACLIHIAALIGHATDSITARIDEALRKGERQP